ncbi:MAG: hypothetical protein IT320_05545 [Anaerolineae bacterium]|nr:hypothetical protein [Anaerolineae bacterium]
MPEKSLAQKLLIKPGHKVAVLNAPDGYEATLGPLPEGATISHAARSSCDSVQLFVYNKADVDRRAPKAIAAVKPGGVLWIAYPKKSGAIKTDISRDHGWDAVYDALWLPVTQLSLDATWSILRFRPRDEIKTLTRKFGPVTGETDAKK